MTKTARTPGAPRARALEEEALHWIREAVRKLNHDSSLSEIVIERAIRDTTDPQEGACERLYRSVANAAGYALHRATRQDRRGHEHVLVLQRRGAASNPYPLRAGESGGSASQTLLA